MSFKIKDGTGQAYEAQVDSRNRLSTVSVSENFDSRVNKESGKVWSIPFEGLNPDGADDFVLFIENTGDKVLHIADIRVMADTTATQLKVHSVTGVAAGGTDITPVSKTIGSSSTPSANIQSGTNLTGLSDAGIIYFIQCVTVNKEEHLSTSSKIRIPKGKCVAIAIETATANITGVITLVEEE